MTKIPTKQELLDQCSGYMAFNKTVAPMMGHKTMIRRIAKGNLRIDNNGNFCVNNGTYGQHIDGTPNFDSFIRYHAPYKIGSIYWVREPAKVIMYNLESTILPNNWTDIMTIKYLSDNSKFTLDIPNRFYKRKRDDYCDYPTWILNSQGIPNGCIKEMARTFIKITDVRVEKLQDINLDEIYKEGYITRYALEGNRIGSEKWFINLWNLTAKKGTEWDSNPYVWVIEYEKVDYD